MTTPAAVTPTQVRYPWRTVRRTIVQVGIPAVLTLGIVVPQIVQIILEEAGESMPTQVRGWLLASSAIVTAVAAALTRIMAIPAVDRALVAWRLSAQPRPGDL